MSPLFPSLVTSNERCALRVGDVTMTFGALASQVERYAAFLKRHGVEPGARVGVWTQASVETCVALVANAAAGYVTVPLDPKLGTRELEHIIGDSSPAVAVAAVPEGLPKLTSLPVVPVAHVSQAVGAPVAQRLADRAPFLVLYTSGTTGLPKGAVIAASSVAMNLEALSRAWDWTAQDTVVHALPLFHVHGLVLGLYGSIRIGGGLHWIPKFEPRLIAAALSARPSMLFAVPTMYLRLAVAAAVDDEVRRGLAAARVLVSGSAALPQRDQQRIESLTGRRVIERYGLTETLINTAVRVGAPFPPGTVGQALEGIELRVVDEHRRLVEAGVMGEIAVRGPHLFLGYLNRADATAAVLDADGWFYTQDMGVVDAAGHLRIVGRKATDIIKCGGFKVGAGEVEAALLEHPQVREAAVVGRPDDDLGERIVAFVVADGDVSVEALERHVVGLLSPHKRPREVRVVSALPRNAMGKVVKSRLS
jgi:malonyl-CoA/methylmalonyl-CoA synthetase